ncbi:JAB domain-containing protein [Novosphingobium sp.]|uniref:JAB domain-containing protein n=1 Tax=Novosphingobium sp. TaxID=1874826 RepID=UPI002605CE57|nr:JAB domain-containing protein [Novosphingobium sp.]
MAAFGSIGSVLGAPPSALARVLDDPDLIDRLGAARAAVMEGLSEQVQRIRFDLTDFSLQQWVVGLFKGLRRERIHLALLDADRRLIFDEPLAEGSLDRVAGNLRKLVGRAIGLDAGAVVLMHNHPSGDVRPSSEDIAATRRISFLLANIDLALEDHLVVADNAIFSMRQANML